MQIKHNVFQILVSLDQFLNCLVCTIVEPNEKVWADETFSSHCYRHYRAGEWLMLHRLIDWLFSPWQEAHCQEAYESELDRAHLPPEERV